MVWHLKYILLSILICSLNAYAQELVSLNQLLNNQEKYNGASVFVYGIVSFEFEKSQLKTSDGRVWLSLYNPPYTEETVKKREMQISRWSIYEGKCVLLSGVFQKGGKHGAGHFGGWPAEITQILSIEAADAKNCAR